jgi:hypothetical protein
MPSQATRASLAALLLLGVTPCAWPQEPTGYIDVRIVNPHPADRSAAVYDNVCDQLILSKRVAGHGVIPAQVCARGLGRGDVTIVNTVTGAERDYRDILRGASLEVP